MVALREPDVMLNSGQDVADSVKFLIRLADPDAKFYLVPTGYTIPTLAWRSADVLDWMAEARQVAAAYGFEPRQLHGSWLLTRCHDTESEETP